MTKKVRYSTDTPQKHRKTARFKLKFLESHALFLCKTWAHAEMTAFAHAQNKLDQESLKGCMLVTSCEPCAMCSGATPWSGVERVIYGAPHFMAEKVGFDEEYKGEHWEEEFAKRKIQVAGPMLGEDAYAPFKLYTKKHGEIY